MYNNYILVILSLFIGFYGTYRFNYIKNPDDVDSRLQELILFFDNQCFHIHHYMWLTIIVISLYIGRYIKKQTHFNMFVAFLVGCAAEGLLFKDWMLIKNNFQQEKIERLFKKLSNKQFV